MPSREEGDESLLASLTFATPAFPRARKLAGRPYASTLAQRAARKVAAEGYAGGVVTRGLANVGVRLGTGVIEEASAECVPALQI